MAYLPAGNGSCIRNVTGEDEICCAIRNHLPARGLGEPSLFCTERIETTMPGPVVLSMYAREAVVLDTIGRTRIRPSLERCLASPRREYRLFR